MQVAANWVWVYLMVAVCIHDIPPSPTLPPVHHTVHIYIEYGEAHTEGVRTPISITHLKIQGRVCACNCQRICVPVSYILWIPPPPCTDEARGWGDTGKGVTQSGSRRSAPGADHSERRRGRGTVCRHTLPTVHYTSYMRYMAQFTGRGGGVTSICRTE